MSEVDEDIRLAVYRTFAARGIPPTPAELAQVAGGSSARAKHALRRLADAHHVVLDVCDHVLMAHPFSAVPMGFSVMGASTLWWGGCAWDSFALPHVVPDEPEVLVATRCPACDEPHAWVVGKDKPPAGSQVAHFLVPMSKVWDDVVHTCGNQRIFCGRSCVDDWLGASGNDEGCVLDLPTLWRLASGWYEGRFEPGYRRRDPAKAAEYFASVGLRGEFWGV